MRQFIERRLEAIRQEWLEGIRSVVTAPEGSEIVAIERTEDMEGDLAIRITTDENAPLYRAVDWDRTHPHRQTELVPRVSERLPNGVTFNSRDLLSVRRTHNLDENSRPEFVHHPRFGGYQYSDAFVDWLVAQHSRDHEFFDKARRRYYELSH